MHGVKVSNDGLVYVADRPNRRVQVFTPEGKYVTQVFINRTGPSAQSAAGVAFSPDKEQQFLYVADYGNSHIAVLDRKSLQLLYQFGERSEKPGDFQGLHHMAVDSKGNIYTGEVAPGARAQRFVFKGLSNTAAAERGQGLRAAGTAHLSGARFRRGARQLSRVGQHHGQPVHDDAELAAAGRPSSRARRSASSPTARAAPGCTTAPSRRSSTSIRPAT